MNRSLKSLDWTLVQSFLTVAETGSLSRAAQSLGQSQPTLGRHIRALEAALGVDLFVRHARGLSLTDMGAEMLPDAAEMRAALTRLSTRAECAVGAPTGTVRIACSVFAAHHILPSVIADLRQEAPGISLVLRPSDDSDNLTFREADIALRMYRPRQLDLIAKFITDIEMGCFAAKTYTQRKGRPLRAEDLVNHDLVGYDTSTLMLRAIADLGYSLTEYDFAVRTDNQTAYWELVRAGCGVGFTQAHLGRSDPLVEELDLNIDIPTLPVWLATHEMVRHIPRVARIWDLLTDAIPRHLAAGSLDPPRPAG